jgi:ABC-2 type transport system permease protein
VSARATLKAMPTMLRIGFSEALAYRAEMIVWVLATTMPLIMLALFSTVAREAPIGRFNEREVTLYFLSTFVVRQLTGSWAAWQINYEVKQGTLATRLLRPVSPVAAYAMEGLAAMPLRLVVALPVAAFAIASVGADRLPHDPWIGLAWCASILGAWLITVAINVWIGALSFFIDSSMSLMNLYVALFFVFSGYLVPVELFPASIARVAAVLPFRYQLGLSVELMTGAHDRPSAFALLGNQWLWVLASGAVAVATWRAGTRRFAAFGG